MSDQLQAPGAQRDYLRWCAFDTLGSKWFLYVTALIYFGYRLYGLAVRPYWIDEYYTAFVARLSWANLLREVARDAVHLPGFHLLLKVWQRMVGNDLTLLRVFSLLLSVAAFLLFRRLMHELGWDARAQNLCLFLVALNPELGSHSYFVRMYGALLVISLLSLLYFQQWLSHGADWDRALLKLLVVNTAGAFTHYSMFAIIGLEALTVALFQHRRLLRATSVLLPPLALIVPWLAFVSQVARSRDPSFTPPWPATEQGFETYLEFFANQILTVSSKVQPAAGVLLVALAIFMILACVLQTSVSAQGGKRSSQPAMLVLMSCVAVFPFTVAYLIKSYAFPSLPIGTLYFIYSIACFLLLIGRGATALPTNVRSWAAALLLLLGVAQGARTIWKTATHHEPDWRGSAAELIWLCRRSDLPCQVYPTSATYYFALDYYLLKAGSPQSGAVLVKPWEQVNSSRCWVVGSQDGVTAVLRSLAARGYKADSAKSIGAQQRIWLALVSL